ncbi:hypothetical protein LWC34_03300 [Kibdelosporangium philippinense]|uniref:Uncharacterized protein n=1 Tax=Kibdelosporangium philippinense TaxID=211113 RepID=A0ABS8Z1P9_9PSEU|nr:hypothetical protein [Kibdelosporangium philippinense]MCE7001866.1 hypothetical protein [Kibdelosporangium philippinense]
MTMLPVAEFGSVSGRLLDRGGVPHPGVRLDLTDPKGTSGSGSVFTDNSGASGFPNGDRVIT